MKKILLSISLLLPLMTNAGGYYSADYREDSIGITDVFLILFYIFMLILSIVMIIKFFQIAKDVRIIKDKYIDSFKTEIQVTDKSQQEEDLPGELILHKTSNGDVYIKHTEEGYKEGCSVYNYFKRPLQYDSFRIGDYYIDVQYGKIVSIIKRD